MFHTILRRKILSRKGREATLGRAKNVNKHQFQPIEWKQVEEVEISYNTV